MIRGDRIKSLRKNKGLTQSELGQMLGVKKSTICCYEKSERNPSFEHIIDLMQVFGVSADYLIGNDHLIKEISDTYNAFQLSEEELVFLEELKKDKFVYEILLQDPKRAAELIKNKIG